MTHTDDEAVAYEQKDLADLHGLDVVVVVRGLQHEEQRVAVELDLRTLERVDRVLHGELVQVELARDRVELGLRRLLQPDPHESALARAIAAGLVRLVELELPRLALAVLVDGAV